MKIRKMKINKTLITSLLVLTTILLLSACTPQQVTRTVAPQQLPEPTQPIQQTNNTISNNSTEPNLTSDNLFMTVLENTTTTREFIMIAKQFEFIPSTINVNQGDMVVLKITSADVDHGFSLPEFNIRENIIPGEETTITFFADKTGTFEFHCDVYCGSGHMDMKGQLIVS